MSNTDNIRYFQEVQSQINRGELALPLTSLPVHTNTYHGETYLTSSTLPAALPTASATVKGAIKLGTGLTDGGGGVINVTGGTPGIHNLVDTVNHPVAGLTTGHYLKATGATTYEFAALPAPGVMGAIADPGTSVDHDILIWDGATGDAVHGESRVAIDPSIGTMYAEADIIAYQAGTPSGDLWDSMPAATTTEMGGFKLYDTHFHMDSGYLHINDSIIVPAIHNLITNHSTTCTTGQFLKATGTNTFGWAAHGLTYSDVGADASGAATSAVSSHEGSYNHANYNAAYSHTSLTNNPHSVTATQVGLGNVTNESKATMFSSPAFTTMASITHATNPYLRLSKTDTTARIYDIQITGDDLLIYDTTSSINTMFIEGGTGAVVLGTNSTYGNYKLSVNYPTGSKYGIWVGSLVTSEGFPQYSGNWYSDNGWGIGASTNTDDDTVRIGRGSAGEWTADQAVNLIIGGTFTSSTLKFNANSTPYITAGDTQIRIYNDLNIYNTIKFTNSGLSTIAAGYLNGTGVELQYNGSTKLATTTTGFTVTGAIALTDSNTTLSEGAGNSVRVTTDSGTMDIGPQNGSWCHFVTNITGGYHFDRQITVESGIVASYDEDLVLKRATTTKLTIGSTSSTFEQTVYSKGDVIAYSV